MPSPTIRTSPGTPSRTAPPWQGPSIIFCGSTRAPCRCHRGRGRCDGSPAAYRQSRASRARPWRARYTGRMLQPLMEANRRRQRKMQSARSEIGLDHCSVRPRRGMPNGECGLASLCVAFIPLSIGAGCGTGRCASILSPTSKHPQRCDDPPLVAARMAVHQHLAAVCVTDGKAGRPIVMSRTARHPLATNLAPVEGPRNCLRGLTVGRGIGIFFMC